VSVPELRCPVCRAAWAGRAQCHRCGADLSPWLRIYLAAQHDCANAVEALGRGDADRAAACANRARERVDSRCARQVALLAELARGAAGLRSRRPT
jgi:hypothetical protein